jgi:hypothetical protein
MTEKPVPLGVMIAPPTPFDSLETWERHLTEVQSLPPFALQDGIVQRAQRIISIKKCGRGADIGALRMYQPGDPKKRCDGNKGLGSYGRLKASKSADTATI